MAKRKYSALTRGSSYRFRKRTKRTGPYSKKRGKSRPTSRFARKVVKVINNYAETKEVYMETASNFAATHNQTQLINSNAFYCKIGSAGTMFDGVGNRVGKSIFCKGIKVAIMLENLQKRAQCTYWLYLIRNKKNADDAVSASNMWENRSTTKPMDYIETDNVHVLFCKKWVVRMPNMATSTSMPASGFAPLAETSGTDVNEFKGVVTNPQKIEKFYVPINKKITFRDYDDSVTDSALPIGPYRYQWVLVSYDNYASPNTGADANIGHVHMTTVMKFTDV